MTAAIILPKLVCQRLLLIQHDPILRGGVTAQRVAIDREPEELHSLRGTTVALHCARGSAGDPSLPRVKAGAFATGVVVGVEGQALLLAQVLRTSRQGVN
jgi:hypothetical protein